MARERPGADDDDPPAHDPDAGVVDDRMAEARERIGRLERASRGVAGEARRQAHDAEDRVPEREAVQRAKPRGEESANGSQSPTFAQLQEASRDLKQRIDEQKRRSDMPINSALGNPDEEARNADGRNDLPDSDED